MIRKQLFQLEDIKGKTVVDAQEAWDDEIVLVFDDSYIVFVSDGEFSEIETDNNRHIGMYEWSTEEEKADYNRIWAERNKKIEEQNRLRKLAHYEKLKAELGL